MGLEKNSILELLAEDYTFIEIARYLGVSRLELRAFCIDNSVDLPMYKSMFVEPAVTRSDVLTELNHDIELFKSIVSILTPVRFYSLDRGYINFGYLLETESLSDNIDILLCVDFNQTRVRRVAAIAVEYFVDGKWLNWYSVIALPRKNNGD